jgi:hypothetical protein
MLFASAPTSEEKCGGMDAGKRRENLVALLGARAGVLASMLCRLSETGRWCDVTFFRRCPLFDVRVDPNLAAAVDAATTVRRIRALCGAITFSDGSAAGVADIWMVHPMPRGGVPQSALDAVDLSEAEQVVGPNGETLRQIIREAYRCSSREEEDRILRRYLAS